MLKCGTKEEGKEDLEAALKTQGKLKVEEPAQQQQRRENPTITVHAVEEAYRANEVIKDRKDDG